MDIYNIAAVGTGAAFGAWLRWVLGLRLNAVFTQIPLGTLVANLVGGLLVGVAVAWFQRHPEASLSWRLFIITGFMGGLTTFSTFSAEVVQLLMRQEFTWALAAACVHLFGSLALTALGIWIVMAVAKGSP